MSKPLPSVITVGLTAITAFSVLFATQIITQPIIENRLNQAYLDLLDLNSFTGYTLGDVESATGDLLDAGIQSYRTYSIGDEIVAMTYDVITTGYASGLTATFTRRGVINSLTAIRDDYVLRVGV